MNSTIVQSSIQKSSVASTGDESYMTFQDLQKKYGDKIAKQIRSEKRRLQSEQGINSTDPPFVKPHPDLPTLEDPGCEQNNLLLYNMVNQNDQYDLCFC